MSTCSLTYRIPGYECDQECTLAPPAVFNYLQDSMDQFSRNHRVGYDFCKEHGLTYMLKSYDVAINDLPHWTDITHMDTVLCDVGLGSLFFKQDLYDQDRKKILLSSSSHVVLIDVLKKRPARVKDCLPPTLADIVVPSTPIQPVLTPLDRIDTTREQEVTSDCIDFNQHVNNTHYVTFAQRALDPAFLKKAKLKRIQVAYRQAAILGEKLKVETKIAPGFTDHQISSATTPGKQFARIRFLWTAKDR